MAKKCPPGVLCMDWTFVTLLVLVVLVALGSAVYFGALDRPVSEKEVSPKIYVVNTPPPPPPVGALNFGIGGIRGIPITVATRPGSDRYQQVGILTGAGGSSGSAAPDRTILPLFGRELDSRRGKWNYFTRTDGNNPVEVPVRYRNRLCDDDMVGCEEVSNDDQVHVPSLGRSFAATVYRRNIFGF
jgi:hypothetical protein